MSLLFSILSMYFFIIIGFSAKKIFQERMDAKTLNLLSIYFLQPFLTLWGLTQFPYDHELFLAPLWYLAVIVITIIILFPLVKLFFKDKNERSIALVAALMGNTGNLGIPIGIAFFGFESVPYMTLINLMNVFVVYTIGVYFYSRGNFSVKDSFLNIVKLPMLWFAILAIVLNVNNIVLPNEIQKSLIMGAYATIVLQLIILGIYLQDAKKEKISKRLMSWVLGVKFMVIPALTIGLLLVLPLDNRVKAMIFLELVMPLAIANVNIASLYDAKPHVVTVIVFGSSLLFLPLVPLFERIIDFFFNL